VVDEDKGYEAYSQGNYELAIREWSAQALAGDPFAKYSLGIMYEHGTGVDQSLSSAIELYSSAAEDGVPQARHNLAWIYLRAEVGVDRIPDGVRLLEENANMGFGDSQSDIALMYLNGDNVVQDEDLAVKYLGLAAEQGVASAQNTLGRMYRYGQCVAPDMDKTKQLYEGAAKQADPTGMFNFAGLFLEGIGVTADIDEAIKWMKLAAEGGLPQAQVNLGALYANAEKVPRDFQEAMKWYQMAADQGDPIGQNNMGLMYVDGQGVGKDYNKALYWLTLSFLGGHEDSRDAIEKTKKNLTSDEIEEVHRLVKEESGGEQIVSSNIDLWLHHANELGLTKQAQKGLLFLCAACGLLGDDREFISRRLNWLFPIDPLRDLGEECGGIYDGKITELIEEMLHHLKAEIEFREITLGDVSIKALNPASHGLLTINNPDELTMFSVDELYTEFLNSLGSVLEESDCDNELAYLAGIFYFQVNVQTDVNGFVGTFRYLEQGMSPVYRYLIDMPAIGNTEQLTGFIPFQRVLYAFISGMSQQTIELLWSLQSYLFYKSNSDGDFAIQYLSPAELAHKIQDAVALYLEEFPNVLESLNVGEMLPEDAIFISDGTGFFEHVGNVVHREWGGMLTDFGNASIGKKLMLNVCVFYVVTAIEVAELSYGKVQKH
jgi:TPR repeat protein